MASRPVVRFQVISDCHMESGTYTALDVPNDLGAKYLILAGDIENCQEASQPRFEKWLKIQCASFTKVFLVAGNNEHKGTSINNTNRFLRRLMTRPGFEGSLQFMERDKVELPQDNITVLGCTLWSNLQAAKRRAPDTSIQDNSAQAHNTRFRRDLDWLKDEAKIVRAENPNHCILIITHYPPTIVGSNKPEFDACRPSNWSAYQSDILGGEGIESLRAGDVWVHGHTHFTHSTYQDEVRVFANQMGRSEESIAHFRHGSLLTI